MKILFCTSSFILNSGGISSYAHDFCEAYCNLYEIVLISSDNYTKKENDKFDVYHLALECLSIQNAVRLLSIIKKEAPDIIINSNAKLVSVIAPFIDSKINLISISHFVNGRLANIAGYNSKYINTIISLSHYGKTYIENRFKIKENSKVVVIYNFLKQNENLEILKAKKNNNTLNIVYPGGASPHKSPDFVYKVLKRLRDQKYEFRFYWLGSTLLPGSKFSFVRVKDIKVLFPHDRRVSFTGAIARDQAISLIEKANIFLLPSKGEGCPISLLEAMRIGTIPIVSDDKHASREIIENGISGFIYSLKDLNSVVERITDIIENHENYINIYDNSRDRFSSILNKNTWMMKMNQMMNNPSSTSERVDFSMIKYIKSRIGIEVILLKNRLFEIARSVKYAIFFNINSRVRPRI